MMKIMLSQGHMWRKIIQWVLLQQFKTRKTFACFTQGIDTYECATPYGRDTVRKPDIRLYAGCNADAQADEPDQ